MDPAAQAEMAEALACCRRGQFEAGISALRSLTSVTGMEAEAHNNLGVALMNVGRHQEAEAAFREAVRVRPAYPEAWGNLGSALSVQGYRRSPLQAYARALQLAPSDVSLVQRTGRELLELGHVEVARRCFSLAVKHRPDDVEAVTGLANTAERAGEIAEAERLLRPLVEQDRLTPNAAAAWARVCLRLQRPADAVGPLETLLARGVSPAFRAHLLFSLGGLHDRLASWERAFAAYEEANDLQAMSWDPAAYTAEIDGIIAASASLGRRGEGPGPEEPGARTILVVGMPRSGTSLVEQILASHPDVHGAGEREELHLLSLTLARRTGRPWPECLDGLDEDGALEFGRWYEQRLGAEAGDASRITDKMPANAQFLGIAAKALPNARVVHCVRDPVDTCLSCYFQQFHHAHAWSTRLDWLGHRHREHDRLMAHWRAVRPLPMLTVSYADMVTDFESQSRRLVAFAGLEWDPAVLDFHSNRRFVGTASYSQVQSPIYGRSLGRARHYDAFLSPLRRALQAC